MEQVIHVFMVDDHPATVKGIKRALESATSANFVWAGDANSVDDAINTIKTTETTINILLLDLGLPAQNKHNGMQLLHWLKANYSDISVIVFSASSSLSIAAECIAAGATGYLCKTAAEDIIIRYLIQSKNEPKLKFVYIDEPEEKLPPETVTFSPLEMWIIQGVLEEKSNDELTQSLILEFNRFRQDLSKILCDKLDKLIDIPINTEQSRDLLDDVRNFIINKLSKNIFVKANVSSRVGLILYTLKWNLFPDYKYQWPSGEKLQKTHSRGNFDKIRVMIVDDHKATLVGLKADLQESGKIIVVATAENGLDAERIIYEQHEKIDVLLTDYKMPVMDGLELTKRVKMRHPTIKIVMLSVDNAVKSALSALGEGAVQYLVKDSSTDDIVHTILFSMKQDAQLNHILLENGALISSDDLALLSCVLNSESAAQIGRKRNESQTQVESSIRRLKDTFGVKTIEGLAIAAYFSLLKKR
jgi:DNA-binding NarL/FixJ family response regulator